MNWRSRARKDTRVPFQTWLLHVAPLPVARSIVEKMDYLNLKRFQRFLNKPRPFSFPVKSLLYGVKLALPKAKRQYRLDQWAKVHKYYQDLYSMTSNL